MKKNKFKELYNNYKKEENKKNDIIHIIEMQ